MNHKQRRLVALTVVGGTAAFATIAWGDYAPRRTPTGRPIHVVAVVPGVGSDGSGTNAPLNTIDILPAMVDISGATGVPTMAPVTIGYNGSAASWRMTGIDINGDTNNVFAFVGVTGCSAHNCTFTTPDRALPTSIDIVCTPSTGAPPLATLVAQGEGGPSDFDMATLRCLSGSAAPPSLSVSPNPVFMPTTPVGSTGGPVAMTLTNVGSGALNAQLAFPPSGEWTATGCIATPCVLTGTGSATTVNVTFTPTAFGDRSGNLVITNNGTQNPYNVALQGSASGATLEVTTPSPPLFEIDFGTIPRGSTAQRALTMRTSGTIPVTADITAPTTPFGVSPAQLVLTPGIPGTAMVTCSSPTAGGPFTQTIAFTSNAYSTNTSSVTARCSVAETDLEVNPTTFDFGEVRVGSATAELPFTLHNPSPSTSLVIHSMRLSSSTAGLSLDAPISSNTTLGPDETRSARIVLDPDMEVDLAGRTLEISVDTSMLSFPITGKVVTPAAHVVPAELELGTACVDSQITGQVLMVNDGTATLTMQRPSMTTTFAGVFTDPTDYPAPLMAGRTATVGIMPSSSMAGTLEGSMTWEVDAPGSPFQVPIHLEYIADGTAISPSRVPFGVVAVETRSERKTVKLENCGDAPVTLELAGVHSRIGGTKVWDVQPERGTIVLPPAGIQLLTVEFAPLRRGSYAATIDLEIDGEAHPIEIFGDASGPLLEPTSFYACACSGPGAPSRGWPVLLALAVVLSRRRSGSSSAHRRTDRSR